MSVDFEFRTYALRQLEEKCPSARIDITMARGAVYPRICEDRRVEDGIRYRLVANIDGQIAFGVGDSQNEAIEALLASFKPSSEEQRAQREAHTLVVE